jgi:hypothetical protein
MNLTHRIWIKCIVLFAALFLAGGVLHAEGNCPEGYSPIGASDGQGGPQGCAPISGYSQGPAAHWTNRWGAIASDFSHHSGGIAADTTSRTAAETVALADCRANGGVQCKVEIWYSNQCAALVAGDTKHISATGATIQAAVQKATNECNTFDINCKVDITSCSFPAQIH